MNPESSVSPEAGAIGQEYAWLQQLERRDWWLWWLALAVIVLLALGMASFAVPQFRNYSPFAEFRMADLAKGLIALVLLFNFYTIYQLRVIKRLRNGFLEQMMRAEKFRRLALFDSLTGVYNRRFAEERLAQETDRCGRKGYDLTVAVLDLNGFKQINDQYGHQAGDTALKEFAQRLQRASRGSDTVARMGGDEFILILPECKAGQLEIVVSRLQNLAVRFHNEKIPLSFSCGSANYRPGQTPEDLLEEADRALYESKRNGAATLAEVL